MLLPNQHRTRLSRVRLGVDRRVGDTDQHHVVLAHPGGGHAGAQQDVEQHVAEVGVRADQKLGPAAIN